MKAPAKVPSDASALEVSLLLRATLCLCWATTVAAGVVRVVAAVGRSPGRPPAVDYHAFMVAGQLAWAGRLADAYDGGKMMALEQQATAHPWFMPWNYPPLFGVMMAPFSRMPIGLAFSLFVLATFALLLLAVGRLTARWGWLVLLTLTPAIFINLIVGQNGMLTGALFAFAAAALVHRRAGQGGLAIGALAYKPHMAVIWPVLLAVRGRWATLAIAGAVAMMLTGISFLAVGPAPFKALIASGGEMSRNMAAGYYPLHRMTSIYAAAASLGLPAAVALATHFVVLAAVLASLVWAGRRLPEPAQAGLAIMSTAFFSPYFYDYDLPLFGVGLALVLPELAARMTRVRLGLLLGVVAAAQLTGLVVNALDIHPSLGGPLLLAAFGMMLRTLAQAPDERMSAAPVTRPAVAGAA